VENFDLIIIGAGTAGVAAAMRASEKGARVCIIEQSKIGGSCFNKGLYPAKRGLSLLMNNKSEFDFNGGVNSEKLFNSINKSMGLLSQLWKKKLINSGVTIKLGRALLVSSVLVKVTSNNETCDYGAKKIILATGSSPVILPTLPFEADTIISIDDVFKNHSIPDRVFIMGAGNYSFEIAHFYQILGSKVFLASDESRLFPSQDPDVIEYLEKSLKYLKVKLLLGKKISSYFKNESMLDITLAEGIKFQVDKIILNSNRQGNSDNLGCDTLGIVRGDRKEILVNEFLETSVPGVFAIGSVVGRKTRPGVSIEEAKIASDNAMGKSRSINYDLIPFIVFSESEVATVGCFVDQAHYKGFRGVEGRVESKDLDFSFIDNSNNGFFKIVADARSGLVIGGQIISPNSSQLISLVVLAIKKGMKVGSLASLAYEKYGQVEGITEAARLCGKAIKSNAKV
jgi:dihydrolipoamide dehydrogenase